MVDPSGAAGSGCFHFEKPWQKMQPTKSLAMVLQGCPALLINIPIQTIQGSRCRTGKKTGYERVHQAGTGGQKQTNREPRRRQQVLNVAFIDLGWMRQHDFVEELIHVPKLSLTYLKNRPIDAVIFLKYCCYYPIHCNFFTK